MIDRIIELSVRHRVAVLLASLAVAVWGAYSAGVAPLDAIPDLSENQVIVFAEWPGRGPTEIEARVTAPLAQELNQLRGVKSIRTSSDFGTATLWVILDDREDLATARRRLAERLSTSGVGSRLPAGVVPRLAPDGPATGQIFWYTVEGPGLDLSRLRAIQDGYVRPRLAAVPGVAEVASVGGMTAELQVEADPIRLRAHQVALEDLVLAVAEAGGTSSGGVLHRATAEFVVRGDHRLGQTGQPARFDPEAAAADLGRLVVPTIDGRTVRVGDVARVAIGPGPRRGVLEKDGAEAVGGVVLMTHGENPLELTRRLKAAIRDLAPGLPPGVRVIPMYDRTPLILGAVRTVSGTVVEAMVCAAVCVIPILLHLRAALVVAVALPLSVLSSFGLLEIARRLGIADVPVNIMSLAGLAISIGVLVDSSIVMTENVVHGLHRRFGDAPIRGDVSRTVIASCRQVGRPIVVSVLIMLLSFLPVFALGGIEGRMFRPLAATKTLAMAASGVLAVTLVPALCAGLIRGRARGEGDSWVIRGVTEVYRPVLDALLDRPAPLVWLLAATGILAAAAIGHRGLALAVVGLSLVAVGLASRSIRGGLVGMALLAAVALLADSAIRPLGREFAAPLDEGVVMDMPISVPRIPIAQGIDDLKARDMVLCRFPEVAMVVGKLGRAETPTDPAPLDMIETMVEFHPRAFWPARVLAAAAARQQTAAVAAALARDGLIEPPDPGTLDEAAAVIMSRFDVQMREYAYQRNRELFRSPGFDEAGWKLDGLGEPALRAWRAHARSLDAELRDRGAGVFTRLALEDILERSRITAPAVAAYVAALRQYRSTAAAAVHHAPAAAPDHAMSRTAAAPPGLTPRPELEAIHEELSDAFGRTLTLRRRRRDELIGFGGELDRAVAMPGWTNIWTMPIQNRVDMLATGVNTAVGIRVSGPDLDAVVATSERIAEVVRTIPGAVDVVADPIRGKGMITVQADPDRAARRGVRLGAIDAVIEAALGGVVAATVGDGRSRIPVRVRYARAYRDDEAIHALLVRSHPPGVDGPPRLIPLGEVAAIHVGDGPATIKGEDGSLRNYVRLNVRGRDATEFVDEARRAVAEQVALPEGCALAWTGQFEHARRARQTLRVIVPVVLAMIVAILIWTYRDPADAVLVVLAIPGAIAGGVVCQWAMGTPFSVTVWVGYIACFGMAAATSVIMLVYLRDAIDRAGGVEALDPAGLRQAVLDGAAQRLRPKLLTEATTLLSLAPMLWATGVGAEVIRPMAAPVLGGILVADEVIDLLLPVLFYRVRLRRLHRQAAPTETPLALPLDEPVPPRAPEPGEAVPAS